MRNDSDTSVSKVLTPQVLPVKLPEVGRVNHRIKAQLQRALEEIQDDNEENFSQEEFEILEREAR